jgi:hypothetical protein
MSSFFDITMFAKAPDCLIDDDVRVHLQNAIRQMDAMAFRECLAKYCPEISTEHRLYGVLVRNAAGGIIPLMVTENGEPIDQSYIIEPGTPIHLLNTELRGSSLSAVIDGELWAVPIPTPQADSAVPKQAR